MVDTNAKSQSAFAGYGLKRQIRFWFTCWLFVAIRFRWIWVEKFTALKFDNMKQCRNPLSLDMGWKGHFQRLKSNTLKSQSAFAGYGLKSMPCMTMSWNKKLSQSAFAGYGLKSFPTSHIAEVDNVAIRFRWIWVEKLKWNTVLLLKRKSQSAFAGYGLKRNYFGWNCECKRSRNPLSLDMGWKEDFL